MNKKILLVLEDHRRMWGYLTVKSVTNSIEWTLGDTLRPEEVHNLIQDRPNLEVKIVEVT